MAIEKRFVSRVDYTVNFAWASTKLGYGKEKLSKMNFTLGERLIETLDRLVVMAEERHFFEIYTEKDEEGWGE